MGRGDYRNYYKGHMDKTKGKGGGGGGRWVHLGWGGGMGRKGMQIGKEEAKLSLFADDMIVYIENPIDSTKKLLNLINKFVKTAGYKVNIQKLKAFLYTNSEVSETEVRGGEILLVMSTRKIKYLGFNLTKEVKDLYSEN